MSGNRRLTRRPMETPGLDINTMPPQQSQYNYGHPAMHVPEQQNLPSQQQFYYNDFTSSVQPEQAYGNNDFGFNASLPINNSINQQQYTLSEIEI